MSDFESICNRQERTRSDKTIRTNSGILVRRRYRMSTLLVVALVLSGCYSFTGSSIPPHIHTIGIPMIEDNSGWGQSDVRQNLTDQLVQKFTNEGSLRVASRTNADALLEVSINANGIRDESVSVKAGEIVTAKKVSITVHATYRDQKKQKLFWERDFTKDAQYEIAQGQAGLKTAIVQAEEKLAEDLLLAAISNW
jgi:hypothetical protein